MLSAFASSLCPSYPISSNCRGEASFKEDRNLWWVCNILTSQVRILISHEIGLEGIEINISNTRLESSSSSQLFDPNVLLGIGIFMSMLLIDQRGGHNFDQHSRLLFYFFFSSFPFVRPAPALNWETWHYDIDYETSQVKLHLEEDDVPVLHNVVLALLAITSSRLHCCFRAVLLKHNDQHEI